MANKILLGRWQQDNSQRRVPIIRIIKPQVAKRKHDDEPAFDFSWCDENTATSFPDMDNWFEEACMVPLSPQSHFVIESHVVTRSPRVTTVFDIPKDVWASCIGRYFTYDQLIKLSLLSKSFRKFFLPAIHAEAAKEFQSVRIWQEAKLGNVLLTDAMCWEARKYLRHLEQKHGKSVNKTDALRIFILTRDCFVKYGLAEDRHVIYTPHLLLCAGLKRFGTFDNYMAKVADRKSRQQSLAQTKKRKGKQRLDEHVNSVLSKNGLPEFDDICKMLVLQTANLHEKMWMDPCQKEVERITTWLNGRDNDVKIWFCVEMLCYHIFNLNTYYLSNALMPIMN